MNIYIERLDGTRYDLTKDYNITIESFRISSPSPKHNFEQVENRDGVIDIGTSYESRNISCSFAFVAQDFPLLRNQLFQIFDTKEAFYLIDTREVEKRWLVKTNQFDPEQINVEIGVFQVELLALSTYAESTFTTLSPDEHGRVLQVKQENFNDPPVQYSFNSNTFFVWNDGDIAIDPREHNLKITFTGASTGLQISNLTNGDVWSYTGSTITGDQIVLDGIRALKNGTSIFRDTNRKLIKLNKGWNQFEITGATDFDISFDFRFLYL